MERTSADLPEEEVRANLNRLSQVARAAGLIGEGVDKSKPVHVRFHDPLVDGIAPIMEVVHDESDGKAEG